jgi:hypothetical protein
VWPELEHSNYFSENRLALLLPKTKHLKCIEKQTQAVSYFKTGGESSRNHQERCNFTLIFSGVQILNKRSFQNEPAGM